MDNYIKTKSRHNHKHPNKRESNKLLDKMQSNFDNKLLKKKKVYDKILIRIHSLMKESATNGKDMCMYVVPEIILGLPIYNLKECLVYIKDTFVNNGFKCVVCEPNIVFVFWKLKNKIISDSNSNSDTKKIQDKSPQEIANIYSSNNISNISNSNNPNSFNNPTSNNQNNPMPNNSNSFNNPNSFNKSMSNNSMANNPMPNNANDSNNFNNPTFNNNTNNHQEKSIKQMKAPQAFFSNH